MCAQYTDTPHEFQLCANNNAAEFGAVLHELTAAGVFGAYTGESEQRLRDVFEAARRDAASGKPVIIFLDEVGAGASSNAPWVDGVPLALFNVKNK